MVHYITINLSFNWYLDIIQDQDTEAENKLNDEAGAIHHYKESEDTEKMEMQEHKIKNEYATDDDMEMSAEAKETQTAKGEPNVIRI